MYNVDDAIAKIDGYVISIAGGGPFVGESKLIRIDEVQAHGGLREHRDRATACRSSGRRTRRATPDEDEAPGRRRASRSRGRRRRTARRGRRAKQATIERLHGQDAAVAAEAAGGVRALGEQRSSKSCVMTYAIIEIGGKQYRVEEGDSVARRPRGRGRGREGLAPRAALHATARPR